MKKSKYLNLKEPDMTIESMRSNHWTMYQLFFNSPMNSVKWKISTDFFLVNQANWILYIRKRSVCINGSQLRRPFMKSKLNFKKDGFRKFKYPFSWLRRMKMKQSLWIIQKLTMHMKFWCAFYMECLWNNDQNYFL